MDKDKNMNMDKDKNMDMDIGQEDRLLKNFSANWMAEK